MADRSETMRALFDHWGWDLPRSDDRWMTVRCGVHEDRHASARVHMNEGSFICLACGTHSGSPLGLVMAVQGLHARAAYRYLRDLGLEGSPSSPRKGPRRPWKGRKARTGAVSRWRVGKA